MSAKKAPRKQSAWRRCANPVLSLLLALALLALALPQPALAARPAQTQCTVNYTVKSGDSLTSIAAKYNVDWTVIARANNLAEPYVLQVGQVLCIPGAAGATPAPSGTTTEKGPTFSVTSLSDNYVVIKTVGYSPKKSYIVKVSNIEKRRPVGFRVIGRFRTNKSGGSNYTVRLPKQFRQSTEMVFCLKDALKDTTQCKGFTPGKK